MVNNYYNIDNSQMYYNNIYLLVKDVEQVDVNVCKRLIFTSKKFT